MITAATPKMSSEDSDIDNFDFDGSDFDDSDFGEQDVNDEDGQNWTGFDIAETTTTPESKLPINPSNNSSSAPLANGTSALDAIQMWKSNPDLYIELEKQKSLVRRAALGHILGPVAPPTESQLHPHGTNTKTFFSFERLPIELCFIIWGLAHHNAPGRVVKTTFSARGVPKSKSVVPALMHVNRESRSEAKKHYTKFCGKTPLKNDEFKEPWINWEKDMIMFEDEVKLSAERTGLLGGGVIGKRFADSNINKLAANIAIPSNRFSKFRAGMVLGQSFSAMKRMVVVKPMEEKEKALSPLPVVMLEASPGAQWMEDIFVNWSQDQTTEGVMMEVVKFKSDKLLEMMDAEKRRRLRMICWLLPDYKRCSTHERLMSKVFCGIV